MNKKNQRHEGLPRDVDYIFYFYKYRIFISIKKIKFYVCN